MATVLVIEADPDLLSSVGETLTFEGYAIHLAATGDQALAYTNSDPLDLIVCDLNLPDMTGYEMLMQFRQ